MQLEQSQFACAVGEFANPVRPTKTRMIDRFRSSAKWLLMIALLSPLPVHAQEASASAPAAPVQANQDLQHRVGELEAQVAELKALVKQLQSAISGSSASPASGEVGAHSQLAAGGPGQAPVASSLVAPKDDKNLDFLRGTTINLNLDGYYGYNFNQPIGRVNLLRAYDVTSNSFSLNQADLVIEHAPDPAAGRRFGARLDLQYGQATETLQGSAVNELRPQVYRPVFQAYGTYVAPVGSGLTLDFGKWASSMGIENNYTKDQINYSRSYFFDFLPFYHMGVRATYKLNDFVTLTYAVVNGVQQTEDFNGFKSQMVFLTLHPTKKVSWNINYHGGEEQPDVVPVLNPGLPVGPTQPGLPVASVAPRPNGWLHIFDSYVTWNATSNLTLAAEADYVINRIFSHSTPAHVDGGAAYARYQLTSKNAIAGRAEYLSDRGGLFSGTTQALKETTLTYEYKFAEGFLMRTEWRRDFSNVPFFRTDSVGKLSDQQNTATIGLVWWWGRKEGAW